MHIENFFDYETFTFTYLIVDKKTKSCAVVDSVLNYDPVSTKVETKSADKIIEYIRLNDLKNEWILETHMHADHITAATYLKEKIGGKIAIGENIRAILLFWVQKLDLFRDVKIDGSQFDRLFKDGDSFYIGSIKIDVMNTPGHTPACCSYIIDKEGFAFVGDTIFAPSLGTGRCDFPGGSAEDMYHTIKKLYSLSNDTKLLLCHDYPKSEEAKPVSVITVKVSKQENSMIKEDTSLEEFVHARVNRDKNLSLPKLLFHSVQANMRAGAFGDKLPSGLNYLRIPVNFS